MLSCLISLFTAPTPASLNEWRQHRQHMFVASTDQMAGAVLSSLWPVSSVIRRRLLSAQARLSEASLSPPPVSSEAGLAAHNCDQQSDKQCLQCHDHIAISTHIQIMLLHSYADYMEKVISVRHSQSINLHLRPPLARIYLKK